MKSGPLLYAILCIATLLLMGYVNLRGYVPFAASNAAAMRSGGGSTAGRFHK